MSKVKQWAWDNAEKEVDSIIKELKNKYNQKKKNYFKEIV